MLAIPQTLPDTTVRVHDWPHYGKSISLSLDHRIVPDEQALRDYCQRRFGDGTLTRGVDHTFTYHRKEAAAPLLLNLFTRLLNKSY